MSVTNQPVVQLDNSQIGTLIIGHIDLGYGEAATKNQHTKYPTESDTNNDINPVIGEADAVSVDVESKDTAFLNKVRKDIWWSCFPFPSRIMDNLEDINSLAKAIGDKNGLGNLRRYIDDRVDISSARDERTMSTICESITHLFKTVRIGCHPPSAVGLLMADAARQMCPAIEVLCDELQSQKQIKNALKFNAEFAIFANAAYITSPLADIRKQYKLYAPLHTARDYLFIKCHKNDMYAPKPRRFFVMHDSSGLELRKFGISRLSEIEYHTPSMLAESTDYGECVDVWDPICGQIQSHEFINYDKYSHDTWISLFIRNDLLGNNPVIKHQRHMLVKLLVASWLRVTDSAFDVLNNSKYRQKLTNLW